MNAKKAGEFDLPSDFKLEVFDSDAKQSDKEWTFSNYSNGNVFNGLVSELIIYNRSLSESEFGKLALHKAKDNKEKK